MTIRNMLRASLATLALLPLACTSGVSGGGPGGGGGGGTTTSSSGSSGSGGSANCGDYADQSSTNPVTATVRNQTANDLYLSALGCTGNIRMKLADANGTPMEWGGEACLYSCEDMQGEPFGCTADCAVPPVILVEPGGSYALEWSGMVFASADMPTACYFDPASASGGCKQHQQAGAAVYTLTAQAWTTADNCDGGSCACAVDSNGSCQLPGFPNVSGTAVEASATVDYPTATSLEIVFQ
jgi:hypothetical protein